MTPRFHCIRAASVLAIAGLLAACAGADKAARPSVYDFGPGVAGAATPAQVEGRPTLLLAPLEAPLALDSTAVLYRLGYADAQQLRPYALARWSMTPAQLLQQRLREHLGAQQVVLAVSDAVAPPRGAEPGLRTLRISLEEFSQLFDAPDKSAGLVRLRATLTQGSPTGEHLVAQRGFVVRQPATGNDAPGGVRALTAASDACAQQIADWLSQQR